MSDSSDEQNDSSNEKKDQPKKEDDSAGISDDQLPEDLQPSEDNPLAEPLTEEEAPDDMDDLDMIWRSLPPYGAGMVSRTKQGNRTVYAISDPDVFELCDLVCGGVRRQIAELDAVLQPGA